MSELSKKKDSNRDYRMSILYTKVEYEQLKANIADAGTNASTYLRAMTIYGKLTARLSPDDRILLKGLIGMSNDIHQLVILARKESLLKVMLYFEAYQMKIDNIVNKLEHV